MLFFYKIDFLYTLQFPEFIAVASIFRVVLKVHKNKLRELWGKNSVGIFIRMQNGPRIRISLPIANFKAETTRLERIWSAILQSTILLLFLRNNVYKAPIIFKKQCLIIQSPYYRNTTHSLHIYPSNFKFRKWKHVSSSFDSTSLFTSLIDDDDIGCLLSPVPPFKNIRIESFRLRVSMFHFLYTQI